jgi:alkylation response protein AidB-like acyl-CoA dehydrogenase
MVQEAIADIMSEYYAATASSFYLAHLLDKIEIGQASDDEKSTYRMLVNINKYITSITGSHIVHRGIEVLGGNGAIESFSILPRLYRDMVVLESWEGTHNVLCVQVMRDIEKYAIHEGFIKDITRQLGEVTHEDLGELATIVHAALDRMIKILGKMQVGGMQYAQTHARRFVDLASYIAQAALLLSEAQWELDNEIASFKPDLAAYFINQHLKPDYEAMDDTAYNERLERLMMAL